MNIYYAPPSQIHGTVVELLDQEAKHASKVMRAREGDRLVVVDGEGGRYEGPIRRISKQSIQIEIRESEHIEPPRPELILGMGIIKKRDRLEFAVEKAVELGVSGIALFRSRRTIKENVRMDRLESVTLSAMKQSLRAWLPEVSLFNSVGEVMERFPGAQGLVAHEKIASSNVSIPYTKEKGNHRFLLMIGPEGGFTEAEVEKAQAAGADLVTLGSYRLRAETAAVALLSQFLS